jgi:2-polyprenyl-3-methyl-5-hydroxy-6-metoxy-1,4-benzoquinol methylase
MDNSWDLCASAWITAIGCGEGRFCRALKERRIPVTGIDPTKQLIERAKELDPYGDYRFASAEELPFSDESLISS